MIKKDIEKSKDKSINSLLTDNTNDTPDEELDNAQAQYEKEANLNYNQTSMLSERSNNESLAQRNTRLFKSYFKIEIDQENTEIDTNINAKLNAKTQLKYQVTFIPNPQHTVKNLNLGQIMPIVKLLRDAYGLNRGEENA